MKIAKILLFVAVCFAMNVDYSRAKSDYIEGVTELCREKNLNTHGSGINVDPTCCKHECNEVILPGETKYGLENKSTHIKRHCNCDAVVYECLSRRQSSSTVGLENRCFYPKKCPPGSLCKGENYEWLTQSVEIPIGH